MQKIQNDPIETTLQKALVELVARMQKLEEHQLELSVFNTYVADKNKFDMYAIVQGLLTMPKNVDIIRKNLSDPVDLAVLDRLVAKWTAIAAKEQQNIVTLDSARYN